MKFLKDNTISGSLEKRTSQVIDRKYIDAKVIEAHIVPGKLLLTRWLLYFFYEELDPSLGFGLLVCVS